MRMGPLETRVWNVVTEDRLQKVIAMGWPTAAFIERMQVMEESMGQHSDPWPKMPWESSAAGGEHRRKGQGCLAMVAMLYVVVGAILILSGWLIA